jgi:adenine-specific DNA methylase
VVKRVVASEDEEGNTVSEEKETVEGGVLVWGNENAPAMDTLRGAIKEFYDGNAPKVLDPFAGGGAIPLEAMRLGCEVTSSDLNPVAWFIQKCTLDYPQRFAGKKWPLPDFVREWPDFVEDFIAGKIKKRKGDKKPHFTDPVNRELHEAARKVDAPSEKASADFKTVSLPDADLAWHVRAWGRWVLERARQELAPRYPIVDGEPTVAYLWARTARDPQTTGRIPLLKTFWLCKKRGKRVGLLPIPMADGSGVTFKLLREVDLAQARRVVEEHDFLRHWEVTAESLGDFLSKGTMNRAGVWSPCSGRPGVVSLTMEDLRRQGQQGLLGTQMTGVVVDKRKHSGNRTEKFYRLPNALEIAEAKVELEDLEEVYRDLPFGIPDEPLPAVGTLGFRIPLYGFKKWRDIFIPRQLLSLGVFVKHTRAALAQLATKDTLEAEALSAYLTILFGRFVNYMSVMSIWDSAAGEVKQTFSRYAFPITWDFAEANPLTESDRYYAGGIDVGAKALAFLTDAASFTQARPDVRCESSLSQRHEQQDVIFTDPPYYDAIPYSDLMDFFFIWQKRLVGTLDDEYRRAFDRTVSPKWDNQSEDGELIQDDSRHNGDNAKAKQAYEDGMASAFQRCCERLADDGRFVVVFANKVVDAWETLVAAMIRSGFLVTTSWPIQTEMPGGFRNHNRASLASSIWIVCRKRPKEAPAGWEEPVLERMKLVLFERREELGGINILQYYFDLGIRGPDFIWAALGPALQAYSEHPFVKKTSGGMMTVREFLNEVRKLVLQFSLGELPGFRELQRETQGRGETVALDPVTQYYLLHRAYFGLTPAPAGACILYANACGKNETELKVVWNILEQGGKSGAGKKGRPRKDAEEGEPTNNTNDTNGEAEESSGSEYRLLDWSERVESDHLGESRGGLASPLVDKLHRLMALFHRNQAGEVQSLYESWGLASERAFPPLLQAIRELALQDGNETERRLVEALATQLKLTRQQVVEDGAVKDAPFFAAIDEATRAKMSYRKQKK